MPSMRPVKKILNEIDGDIYYLCEIKECSFIVLLKYYIIFYLLEYEHKKELRILIQHHKSSKGLITIPPNVGFILMVYVSLLILKKWPKDAIHSARIQIKIQYELICAFRYFFFLLKKFIMVLINANSLFLSPHLLLPSLKLLIMIGSLLHSLYLLHSYGVIKNALVVVINSIKIIT